MNGPPIMEVIERRPDRDVILKLTEMIRAHAENPHLFMEDCLKIRAKSGEVVPFHLNRAQLHVHGMLEKQRREKGRVRAVILKGRQQGMSTYVQARFFHRIRCGLGLRAQILTHLDEATRNLFGMARRFYENLPELYQTEPATSKTANGLAYERRDCEITVATAGSKNTGRSATAQLFHGSEVGFWPNALDHMAGIGQIVPNEAGTEIILESTGNGEGNLFHSLCVDAMRGTGDYIMCFVPWFWQPEYRLPVPPDFQLDPEEADYAERYRIEPEQMVWRRAKLRTDFRGDVALFDQEYPAEPALAFTRRSEESYIPSKLVNRARHTKVDYVSGNRVLGVDPAEYGEDTTVMILRQGRKAFPYRRYHGKNPMEVAGLAARMADDVKADFINVDATGIGSGVAARLAEMGYPVRRIVVGERAVEADEYVLVRDEIWGEMKKWLEDLPAELPDDDALAFDLSAPSFTYDSSRRLKLESKEQMKKRGVKSPDAGDALALTFAVREAAVKPRKLDRRRRIV